MLPPFSYLFWALQEKDAFCDDRSGCSTMKTDDSPEPHCTKDKYCCPDPCAYSCCNCGQSYTVQCPKRCFTNGSPVYGDPKSDGKLGPYEDISSICRAAILNGRGTNDDSFYVTFTIVHPVRAYQDPGGVAIRFEKWDWAEMPDKSSQISDRCCKGGFPPQRGRKENELLEFRAGYKNEWQNIRAFVIEPSVSNLCPPGYKFKKGALKSGGPVHPSCVVSAKEKYVPVPGCDECVLGAFCFICYYFCNVEGQKIEICLK